MSQSSNYLLITVILSLSVLTSVSKAEYLSNEECFTNLESNLKLEQLKDKVTLSNLVENQKLSLIVDKKKPNDIEKKLLIQWDELRQDCIKEDLENLKNRALPFELINFYQKKEQQFKFLLADLYSGKISFGEFNMIRQKINFSSKIEEGKVIESLKFNKSLNQSDSKTSLAVPNFLPNQSNYATERQKGIDSLNCEVYAKTSTANQRATVPSGPANAGTLFSALAQDALINKNTKEYYDSCMKRLGY